MKKLLNSPLFVGAIALIAVGVVAMNVIRPMIGSGTPSRAVSVNKKVAEPEKGSDEKAIEPTPATNPDEVADRKKIRWKKTPAIRDPFKPKAPVARKVRKTTMGHFRLYGIWVEPGIRFAAINDEIVSEGDRIGEYRVAEIKPDSVLLKGPKGNRLLKFRNR